MTAVTMVIREYAVTLDETLAANLLLELACASIVLLCLRATVTRLHPRAGITNLQAFSPTISSEFISYCQSLTDTDTEAMPAAQFVPPVIGYIFGIDGCSMWKREQRQAGQQVTTDAWEK